MAYYEKQPASRPGRPIVTAIYKRDGFAVPRQQLTARAFGNCPHLAVINHEG